MNYRIYYSDELYHYGVKGMKWGVRKEYVPKGRKKASGNQPVGKKKHKGLSRNQKIAIGAAVGTAALVGAGIILYKTGNFDKLTKIGRKASRLEGHNVDIHDLLSHRGFDSIDVNKNVIDSFFETNAYHKQLLGSTSNCTGCAIADFLKDSGISVKASMAIDVDPVSGMATKRNFGFADIEKAFVGTKAKEVTGSTVKEIRSNLLRQYKEGDGGVFGATFTMPDRIITNHAIRWKIENGKVKFSDSQAANSYLRQLVSKGMDEKTARRTIYNQLSDLDDSYLTRFMDLSSEKMAINLKSATDIVEDELRKFVY